MHRVTRFGRDAFVVSVAFALITALAVFSPRSAAPVSAQATTVSIVDFSFSPASVQIMAGTTVTWVNNGAAPHTATGSGFDTGNIAPGGSASFTFNTPGTYSYICSIHPQMTASIVVTAAADDDGDDDGATTGNTTTNLPNTGAGAALGRQETLPLAAGLAALALLLGVAGMTVLRRADR